MTVRELANQLERLSAQTTRQFTETKRQFTETRKQFTETRKQFAETRKRFAETRKRSAEIDLRFERLHRDLDSRIREEGEATRRHFDIVAEQFRAETRLALDKSMAAADQLSAYRTVNEHEHAGFAGAIDNHDARLRVLERLGTIRRRGGRVLLTCAFAVRSW